jgi:hypothetical protein
MEYLYTVICIDRQKTNTPWPSFHVFQPNAAKVIIKKFSYPKGVLDFKSASFASHAFSMKT